MRVREFGHVVCLERVQEEHIGAREVVARRYICGIYRGSEKLLQWDLSLGSSLGVGWNVARLSFTVSLQKYA